MYSRCTCLDFVIHYLFFAVKRIDNFRDCDDIYEVCNVICLETSLLDGRGYWHTFRDKAVDIIFGFELYGGGRGTSTSVVVLLIVATLHNAIILLLSPLIKFVYQSCTILLIRSGRFDLSLLTRTFFKYN